MIALGIIFDTIIFGRNNTRTIHEERKNVAIQPFHLRLTAQNNNKMTARKQYIDAIRRGD